MPGTDYYKVLGVAKTASDDDIKKVSGLAATQHKATAVHALSWLTHAPNACVRQAYRKLAMKHHPDKNPGANRSAAEKKARPLGLSPLGTPTVRCRSSLNRWWLLRDAVQGGH